MKTKKVEENFCIFDAQKPFSVHKNPTFASKSLGSQKRPKYRSEAKTFFWEPKNRVGSQKTTFWPPRQPNGNAVPKTMELGSSMP